MRLFAERTRREDEYVRARVGEYAEELLESCKRVGTRLCAIVLRAYTQSKV